MLNFELKKQALMRLEWTVSSYEFQAKRTGFAAVLLHQLRVRSSTEIIGAAERYVNSLANVPKEFAKAVADLGAQYLCFTSAMTEFSASADPVAAMSGSIAAAGVLAGAGVAAFAPSAALAIATTFGTASTGTAISALSGAAASNAALAWLGGGAVAAGGGGMAAGEALLALAGPIGWTVAGLALVGAGLFAWSENAEAAAQADQESARIMARIYALQLFETQISGMWNLTTQHATGASALLQQLAREAPRDYRAFSVAQKEEFAALINDINSLSSLLNRHVSLA